MAAKPQEHHRRSIRLPGYDYSQAEAYFVTLVTHERLSLFGEIVGEDMRLNGLGQIVQEEWCRTPTIRPEIELDAFQVMPNHIHGILVIQESPINVVEDSKTFGHTVGAHGREGRTPTPYPFASPVHWGQ